MTEPTISGDAAILLVALSSFVDSFPIDQRNGFLEGLIRELKHAAEVAPNDVEYDIHALTQAIRALGPEIH